MSDTRTKTSAPRGFSLIEVILALAILAGALTVLGQVIGNGNRSAIAARDLSYAQLLCSSKMDEIRSGLAEATTVTNASFPNDPEWNYSVETSQIDQQGVLSLRVTVSQSLPPERRPIQFWLTSWIADPGFQTAPEQPAESESATSTPASSTTSR